jgi:dextranase
MKRQTFLLIALVFYLIFLNACHEKKSIMSLELEKEIMSSTSIKNVHFEKSYFHPGELARWTVIVHSEVSTPVQAVLSSQLSFLEKTNAIMTKQISLSDGDQEISFEWLPPKQTPRGYGLDIELKLLNGTALAHFSLGIDVLDNWTQMPRYGFLSDFEPGRIDAAQTLQTLTDFHINGLQFYDWMYRHEKFLTDQDPYVDLLGRTLSIKTVNTLIDEGHKHSIAAMPYTAIYATSIEFYNSHKEWALYYANGDTVYLGDFMAYMDPRPNSEWMKHLMNEFADILTNTKFDGIHLDQYGDPKEGYDFKGEHFQLGLPIAEAITETHSVVDKYRSDGAVVFNCVTNWPVDLASKADEDIIYIEVWDPYKSFSDLHNLISYAQSLGTGKPVVLAAYVHPGTSSNPRLMDAVIFGSGGGHIELGENSGYLAHAYFPNYEELNPDQAKALRNYYDFAIRYQNLIGPQTEEATSKWISNIKLGGLKTGLNPGNDVFPLVRRADGYLSISLVNFSGLDYSKWNEPITTPEFSKEIALSIEGVDQEIKNIYFSSPDEDNISLLPLLFEQNGEIVTLKVPSLKYWDLIVLEL